MTFAIIRITSYSVRNVQTLFYPAEFNIWKEGTIYWWR